MNPVVYSAQALAVVNAYDSLPVSQKLASYWSDQAIAELKKEIKNHYIAEQLHRCAYCQHPFHTNNNAVWDAEHIISKNKNPEFMFEPRNLAISCKDCNIAKREQEVRRTQKAAFPITSQEYIIVHPHFDNYADHIGWVGEICFAKSDSKGSKTISMCNLTRYAAMSLGENINITDDRFNRLVADLMAAKTEQDGEIVLAGIKAFFKVKNSNP